MKLNWANRITISRILLIIPFIIFMLKINDPSISLTTGKAIRYGAFLLFLIMALSDALDGYLARIKNQATRLGSFLDPMADKLLMTCACLLLASNRSAVNGFQLPPTVVVLIIGKDMFLFIGFVIVYFITSQVRIIPAPIGKVATTLQLTMVAGILMAPEISHLIPGWIWFLRVVWWSAAGTAILSTLIYIRIGSRYIGEYEETMNEQTSEKT
ncbi:MAG: CDP-alcohol phosphatidyltransferase family protein [Planctomycetota bacterium]